jgi:NDP-sugar pyrophosphorylase family protein
MKALILAAGFGTRLLPYTRTIPKPLFTLMERPILDHAIEKLAAAGCEQILINTHHLNDKIDDFVRQTKYAVDIQTIHEPDILDTGGAIANARPFLKDSPFFVINSDIISNVDLNRVFKFHQKSDCLATLVLHDYEAFNKVEIDDQGYILSFDSKTNAHAFTGIQVLSPRIYDYFPDPQKGKKIFSSIEIYQSLCSTKKINSIVENDIFWSDIGTKDSYSRTSLLQLAAAEFGITPNQIKDIEIEKLAGDGSDRLWFRAKYKNHSKVISDHGICLPETEAFLQINAFVNIGNHLFKKELPVPGILNHDTLSGMVILDDLGDVHLEGKIKQADNDIVTLKMYKKVIDILIDFSIKGYQDFNKKWTCQTQTYSKELIIQKECLYFMEAFIQGYLNLDIVFDDFLNEFNYIANHALKHGVTGLMHRDFQSRNIMIRNDNPFIIDFQSARQGPLQYDLASLLIDPYVNLNDKIKNDLLQYTMGKLELKPNEYKNFSECYQYCSLTRNLQFLGAFAFLSKVKNKTVFEQYIPDAVKSLKKIIAGLNQDKIHRLSKLVQTI